MILIANDLNLYFHGRRTKRIHFKFYDQDNNPISTKVALEKWLLNLKYFVKKMQNRNIKVILLGSMPSFPDGAKYICFYRDILSEFLPVDLNDCVDNVISRRKKVDGTHIKEDILGLGIKEISDSYDNFLYFDPTDVFCEDKTECKVYDGNKLISVDGSHYSKNAAMSLYDALEKKLSKVKFLNKIKK